MAKAKLHNNQLDWWIVLWFYITAIICTIDASFVVFRPHTLPGGSAFIYFYPYKYYIEVDQRYAAVNDSYVFTQSLMNYVEVLLNIVTLVLHYQRDARTKLLAFTVSIMTFWKTVLYVAMFYELAGGSDFRAGNSLIQEIFIVLIPNGIWLLIPYMCMAKLYKALLNTGSTMNKYN